jgi:hypothetical protein
MEQIKIKIDNKEFIIKQTFRSLMLFEEITKKPATQVNDSLTDIITLFYCVLKGANKTTFNYTQDEFIDLLDTHQDSINVFTDYLQSQAPEQTPKKKVTKK